MRDLNFFEIREVKESDVFTRKLIIGGTIAMTAFIGITATSNMIGINRTQESIDSINAKINDAAFQAQYAESLLVSKEEDAYSRYNSELNNIYTLIADRDKVNPHFFDKINSTIPSEVVFTSINFSGGTVSISAKSTSREAIAELQHNINSIEFIKESHIGGIASDMAETNELFTFAITCELEEAYYDESK